MPILTINLGEVRTRAELAAALCVRAGALSAVTLVESNAAKAECRRSGCPLSAVVSNNGWCVLCSQSWFPRKLDRFGQPAKNRRGYGLFGTQFLRTLRGKGSAVCCCSSELCMKLGYSHHGMFRFPSDPKQRAEAARVLGIPAAE